MITTIIFDLSEVYLQGIVGSEKTLIPLVGKKVVPLDFVNKHIEKYFHGEITEVDYLQATIRDNQWDVTSTQLGQVFRNNFREIEGVREIIELLQKQGYKLGLLSVHGKEWIAYCEETFNYRSLFQVIHYSYERKITKPEKQAYIQILEELKSKPEETIFIDDLPENIKAAKELCINGIQFTNVTELKEQLKTIGIKV